MAGSNHHSEGYGPVGPAPQEHQAVYTTLHFDKPWSYENYLKTGGYQALRKILTRSEEHTSELQSLMRTSYAVFCLKKQTSQAPALYHDTIATYVFSITLSTYPLDTPAH